MSDKYLNVKITTPNSLFVIEKRYSSSILVQELKEKLELVTGIQCADMVIDVYHKELRVCSLTQNDELFINFISPESLMDNEVHLYVYSRNGKNEFDDIDVSKLEMSEEDYEKRSVSMRAFKKQHKLGRFGDTKEIEVMEEVPEDVTVGSRCRVTVKGNPRRFGTVMYVGHTKFKPGIWVGVKYDEPMGKNDGSVEGVRYFECPAKYGGFVRLPDVEVGDFVEEGIDELDEL
ncbi:hypothetical protein B4U80_10792 [Leptotrombidium deliense]|uniref:CAP-Gly domain-containing protein n=1 Tax=Leptotrombidium deliense TaxID=299467 RepID=A0A443SDT4_9ACAR|nr:hypothetical protein B4U80_10792 [Leptotrombidium deliense]